MTLLRNLGVLMLALISISGAFPMVLEVNTNLGSGTVVQLPLKGSNDTVWVSWGDGAVDTILSADIGTQSHTYATEGTYTIEILGGLTRYGTTLDTIYSNKFIAVNGFGNLPIWDLSYAFTQHNNLDTVTSTLPATVTSLAGAFSLISQDSIKGIGEWDVSNVTNMQSMFSQSTQFNQDLSQWVTSSVDNFSHMFYQAEAFNSDLSLWNTSEGVLFGNMFYGATSFNQNIGAWITSKATSMYGMFQKASAFNQDLTNWDVDSVTTMQSMFSGAHAFAGDLSGWRPTSNKNFSYMFYEDSLFNSDISAWTTDSAEDFSGMFRNAISFNQNINGWNTSQVTDMGEMFNSALAFRQDLNSWDVSNVEDMAWMFAHVVDYNGDISAWNPIKVRDFRSMFFMDTLFNQDISGWNTDSARDMSSMFRFAASFNQSINSWNTSKVEYMNAMFDVAKSYNQPMDSLDVSQVKSMSHMFQAAYVFNQDLSSWDVSQVETMRNMFYNAYAFNGDLSGWRPSKTSDFSYMFYGDTLFNSNISAWTTDTASDFSHMFNGAIRFNQDISSWNTEDVTNMASMFYNAKAFNQPLNGWDVSQVEDFSWMFYRASVFNQDLNNWDVGAATTMQGMFYQCFDFNGDLSTWRPTLVRNFRQMFVQDSLFNSDISAWTVDSARDMQQMFDRAIVFNQDLNNWNTENVTNMHAMFASAHQFNGDISSWKTQNVTNMASMFYEASNFNSDISAWDVSQVRTMEEMFYRDTVFNADISGWQVDSVRSMGWMFYDASAFNQDISGWTVDSVSNMYSMFFRATNFNQNLNSWNVSSVTNMFNMFLGADQFEGRIYDWDVSQVTQFGAFLNGVGIDSLVYDSILNQWSQLDLQPNLSIEFWPTTYTLDAVDAKDSIISKFNWSIYDGGLSTPVAPRLVVQVNDTILDEDFIEFVWFNLDSVWRDDNGDNLGYSVSSSQDLVEVVYNSSTKNLSLQSRLNVNGVDTIIMSAQDSDVSVYDTMIVTIQPVVDVPNLTQAFNQFIGINDSLVISAAMTDGDPDQAGMTVLIDPGTNYTLVGDTLIPDLDFSGNLTVPIRLIDGLDTLGPVDMLVSVTEPMILTYDLSLNAGTTIDLPLFDTVQVRVDWGDQRSTQVDTVWNTNSRNFTSHTYSHVGVYEVKIYGHLTQFGYYNGRNQEQMTHINSFGQIGITSLEGAFAEAHNLDTVPSVLPPEVTSLESLFEDSEAVSVTGIESWNTENVTTLEYFAYGAYYFNQDISNWDVSNVENFYEAFYEAEAFNQPIGKWNVSSGIDMTYIFEDALSFNQPLDNWVFADSADIEGMFYDAASFNQDLDKWDVSKVTDMTYLFSGAEAFNGNISTWNVAQVEDFGSMFEGASAFNSDISSWVTSSAIDLDNMFEDAASFNQDISGWDLSQAEDLDYMFEGAFAMKQDISDWNISKVNDFSWFYENNQMLTPHYDSLLIKWSAIAVLDSLTLNMGASRYTADAQAARDYLINTRGWNIQDSGLAGFERIAILSDLDLDEDFGTHQSIDLNDYYHDYNGGAIVFELSLSDSILGVTLGAADSVIQLTSQADVYGVDTLFVSAIHADTTYLDTLVITVASVNDAPVITSISSDSGISGDIITLSMASIVVTDVEGDPLSVVINDGIGYVVTDSTIEIDSDFSGQLSVDVQVTDGMDTSLTHPWLIDVEAPVGLTQTRPGKGVVRVTPQAVILNNRGDQPSLWTVEIVDASGAVIFETSQYMKSQARHQVPLSLNSGRYYVQVQGEGFKYHRPILVQ